MCGCKPHDHIEFEEKLSWKFYGFLCKFLYVIIENTTKVRRLYEEPYNTLFVKFLFQKVKVIWIFQDKIEYDTGEQYFSRLK